MSMSPSRHLRTWLRSNPACFVLPAALAFFSLGLQAGKADPPSGPLLANAPEFSQWIVTFTYPEEKETASELTPPKPKPAYFKTLVHAVTTTKTHSVVHEVFVDEQGQQSDLWHVGTAQYQKQPGSAT